MEHRFVLLNGRQDDYARWVISGPLKDGSGCVNSIAEVIREYAEPAAVRASLLDSLSAREREVFHLVARGLSNSEISKTVFLSDATVKSHVRAVLQKLDLRSRIQVVILAYENNLNER